MLNQQVDVLRKLEGPEPTHPLVRLFWIGVELVSNRKVDTFEMTGNYTDAGEAIKRKTGERHVPVQLQIVDRLVTMPQIGESLMVPEHLVREYLDRGRIYDREGNRIEGFTTNAAYAESVKKAYLAGKPIPRNMQGAVAQEAEEKLNALTAEQLRARLAELEGAAPADDEETAKTSTRKSKKQEDES